MTPAPIDHTLLESTTRSGIQQICFKLAVFCGLIFFTLAACYFIKPAATVTEAGVVMKWPDHIFDFSGKDESVSEGELKLLPADTEFAKKLYTDPTGEQVSAEIVLSGVEHRSIHRPEVCLSGQGWTVRNGQVVSVPLKSGRSLDVMVLDITRPFRTDRGTTVDLPALYAYFFVSKDAETAKHLDRVAITNLDLLLHNKSHRWAYVIAMARVLKGFTPDGKDRDQTLQTLKDFIREAAPTFLKSEISAKSTAKITNSTTPPDGI